MNINKPWLKNYPEGVPEEINPDEYDSLLDLFKHSVNQFRHLPAYSNMGSTITFEEIDKQSRAFAAFLQSKLLVKIELVLGCISLEGKPKRIPKYILNKFKENVSVAFSSYMGL